MNSYRVVRNTRHIHRVHPNWEKADEQTHTTTEDEIEEEKNTRLTTAANEKIKINLTPTEFEMCCDTVQGIVYRVNDINGASGIEWKQ